MQCHHPGWVEGSGTAGGSAVTLDVFSSFCLSFLFCVIIYCFENVYKVCVKLPFFCVVMWVGGVEGGCWDSAWREELDMETSSTGGGFSSNV